MVVLTYAGAAVASFLVGAIPFSWVLGKLAGYDLRRSGSGNPGATNLYRTAGPAWGIPGLLLDVGKGVVPVIVAQALFPDLVACNILAGAATIAGHIWTPYLDFRGGKGVATATGVFFALNPVLILIAVAVFATTIALTRYVSLGSIFGVCTAFVGSFGLPLITGKPVDPYFVAFCGACAAAIIITHRKNIARLGAGTENRLGGSRKK